MALKPIAYVQASWHADITDHCKTAFMAEITTRGYRADEVEFFAAPGSLEIPLIAKKLAKSGRYAAVCASGLVVDGGIYRTNLSRMPCCKASFRPRWKPGCRFFPQCSRHITFTLTPSTRRSSRNTCARRAGSWRRLACRSSRRSLPSTRADQQQPYTEIGDCREAPGVVSIV